MSKAVIGWTAAVFVAVLTSAPALAIDRPTVDSAAVHPDGAPGPVAPMEQRGDCVAADAMPGADLSAETASQRLLNLSAAQQVSHGDGQLVAVIDTGVRPGPRLPAVEPGGDYLAGTDGLTDCDGHGTLVAGIIAGQPGDDGFTGVAPGARLLALRATSAMFAPRSAGEDPALTRAVVDIDALSRAIVHAADLGARVIAIPMVICVPADRPVDQNELGAALRYAAVDKDAVIVSAAGDAGQAAGNGPACDSNPLGDSSRPGDPRNWAGVTSVSAPSLWQQYVLSVGSVNPGGAPSAFTMAGPWLGVAAPGENIVSVSNRDDGGLANALPGAKRKLIPLNGTGYAAGYVSGLAALVRSALPALTAAEVIDRISATAHSAAQRPSNRVGSGTVDPVAALTWELAPATQGAPTRQLPPPPSPTPTDPAPRRIAYLGTAALAAVAAIVIVVRRRQEKEPTP